ncbi:hypothetical protein [Reichenbachiella sp.]|uniref:hypothetical protein n=1 Tax=Reichenbachiella sp. TaxID=2184521 RepID=UPI003299E34E
MIIGSKEIIAIEFNLVETNTTERKYGNVSLYLDNRSLGYYDDPISLDAFNLQLKRLINNQDAFFDEFKDMSHDAIFEEISKNDDVKFDSTLFSLGESFDDFDIRYIKIDDEVRFLWRLSKDHFFSYEDENYDIHGYSIKIEEIEKVQQEFDNILANS